MPDTIQPVQPVHIDLTQEKQQWSQAVYGKEVRQSAVDAYTKIEHQLNATVDQLVDSINAANATTQASADAVSAANSAAARAQDAVGASAQALQSAENAVRRSEEALNEAGTTLTAVETFARSAEEDAESAKTDADRAKEEADRAAQFTNLAGTNIQVIEIGQDMETIDLNEYTVPGFYKVNSIEGRVTVNNAPVNIGYATGFAMIVTEAGMDMMSDVFTKYVQIIICSNVMYVREKNTQQFGLWTSWTELTGGTPVAPTPAAVTPSADWLDGKTLVIDGNKIRADQPYINAPTATTSWKLSSHTKAGVYAFKILAGVSAKPQDAPAWFTGSTDFCLEVVPFNGDGTNSKGCVLQRFSTKERISMRFVDVGSIEAGGNPGEWKDVSLPADMDSRITKLEGRNLSVSAKSGISGDQYIPIGAVKASGSGNGAVYGLHIDSNIYGRMKSGGFGFASVCLSVTSCNGVFTISGSTDCLPDGWDIVAYMSTDSSKYNLFLKTNYGGTKGELSYYTNAGTDVTVSIGTGTATVPSGTLSGSLGDSIVSGTVDVLKSIRDVTVLYSGTASVDGGAVALTESLAGYKMLSFACFNGQDRHTGTLMCDALEAGIQYVVPVGSGYIKFSYAGDQFTLISNTVGANLHRIYGKK